MRRAATTSATAGSRHDPAAVLDRVLEVARDLSYEGYSKHDALNARWLEASAGRARWTRLAATQAVMRSPIDVRPLIGVSRARNPKGISLFARALLARHRMTDAPGDAAEAAGAARLADRQPGPSGSTDWRGATLPVAGRRVLRARATSRIASSRRSSARRCSTATRLWASLGYLEAASQAVRFLLEAPRTLFEDDRPPLRQLRARRVDRPGS